jgi:UDP-N-acetylmuramate dehydrogenase
VIARQVREGLTALLGDRVQFNVAMARHTSLRVGGPADAVATPESPTELAQMLVLCTAHRISHTLLGGGFNTLVLDAGVDGVVIRTNRLRRLEARPDATLLAEAGVSHARVTRFCSEQGLTGLEFAAGIPGTVGGWLAMNAGVPERETKDAVREVEVLSPTGAKRRRFSVNELCFAYRGLRGLAHGSVVLSAVFELTAVSPERVRNEIERVLARRRDTQPLDVPSCGSVFKNPRGDHAGRLIELAGLKGEACGGAEISSIHANFIVNKGIAKASDVLALMHRAQARVRAQTGIVLEPEVRILGRPT